MAVDRDDWHYAALTGLGKPRAAARALSSLKPVFAALTNDERLADVGLVWTMEHHHDFVAGRSGDWKEPSSIWVEQSEPKEHCEWWTAFGSLVGADQDVCLLSTEEEILAAPVVVYAGPRWAADWVGRALTRRLELGLPVVTTGKLPVDDLAGSPRAESRRLSELAPNAVVTTPGDLVSAVERAGARNWTHAEGGLLSTAYRRDDGSLLLFVVNPRATAVEARLALREELRGLPRSCVFGEDPFVAADSVRLPPRGVAVLRLGGG
jgi:hypothetical protein